MHHILIVEDEPRISSFVAKGLAAGGFATAVAADGDEGLARARSGDYDLVLLDLGLPGRDGVTVLRELRAEGRDLPVIVLTARDGVADTVRLFESGADDYLSKPFAFEELLARVRARLRAGAPARPPALEAGGVRLDLGTRRALAGGAEVDLTAREFTLLEALMRHPGQVLSREQLLSQVWGYDHDPGSNVVDVYVGYLRRKLGGDTIETVRGMGYRMRSAPPAGA